MRIYTTEEKIYDEKRYTPDILCNTDYFVNFRREADLGQPIQETAAQYQGVVGLFAREFEKGWAVYNRSGSKQTITFNDSTMGVNGGNRQFHHEIPDFDGEILLKEKRKD